MRKLAFLALMLAASCAPVPPAYGPPAYPPPDYAPPPPAGPPSYAPPPAPESDQCGASRYSWLIGRHRSSIPPQPPGQRWRVACLGCPVTMDYSPSRLNIFYEERTGIVRQVRCG